MEAKTFKELFAERIGKSVSSIEEITFLKYNHNHDPETGRFTSGSGAESTISSAPSFGAIGGYKHKEKDYGEMQTNSGQKKVVMRSTAKVKSKCTTETPDPIKKEPFKIESVMKECQCSRETAEAAHKLASDIFEKAQAEEPKITGDLLDVAKKTGGEMYGLDFRMKQETSLARKIVNDANDDYNGDLNASARAVKDAVRFTMVFEDEGFTKSYRDTKATLEAAGYTEMRCKNYWDMYASKKSNPIKSVQSVFMTPDGTLFELQFQTYNSQGAKEISHPMYEEQRSKSTSSERAKELGKQMRHLYSHVNNPPSVREIESHTKFD